MLVVLDLIQIMHARFAFKWVLTELRTTLENELDFEKEAANAERCRRQLSHLTYLHVPRVRADLTSPRVLTAEFIHGIKISDNEALRAAGLSLADIDRKVVRIFAEQVFHTGFVHADPHPGNLMVRKVDNTSQIVLLGEYVPSFTGERPSYFSIFCLPGERISDCRH
jgi:aarF domain-containing kinase